MNLFKFSKNLLQEFLVNIFDVVVCNFGWGDVANYSSSRRKKFWKVIISRRSLWFWIRFDRKSLPTSLLAAVPKEFWALMAMCLLSLSHDQRCVVDAARVHLSGWPSVIAFASLFRHQSQARASACAMESSQPAWARFNLHPPLKDYGTIALPSVPVSCSRRQLLREALLLVGIGHWARFLPVVWNLRQSHPFRFPLAVQSASSRAIVHEIEVVFAYNRRPPSPWGFAADWTRRPAILPKSHLAELIYNGAKPSKI